MSDQTFREIQLGTKQLLFLFMASVVLAVAIFLLGVSVGRGVRSAAGSGASMTDSTAGAGGTTAVDLPPATQTEPADLAYHSQLQGQTPPAPAAGAPAATDAPVAAAEPAPAPATAAVSPASAAAMPASPQTKTADPKRDDAPATKASTKAGAVTTAGWAVQVGAFSSRENAENMVAQLKRKGFTAFVFTSDATRLFHVRVGPFSQRAEAESALAKLRGEVETRPEIVSVPAR